MTDWNIGILGSCRFFLPIIPAFQHSAFTNNV
jgi:hypothetical protein